jgi:hypothetical protein
VLAVGVLNFLLTAWILNITLIFAIYFAVPLLAAAVAAFPDTTGRRRRMAMALFVILIAGDATIRLAKYARVAATWAARDPAPLEEFVASNLPPGSVVFGPAFFYFYAVERAGSYYVTSSRESEAAWPRHVEPGPPEPLPAGPRYLLWSDWDAAGPLPPALACPGSRLLGTYQPAPDDGWRLGPLETLPGHLPDTYAPTQVYALPPGCGW